jgi:hypothetical protein
MKTSRLFAAVTLAVLISLCFFACKRAASKSSGPATVATDAKEHHTKGHKKAEKKKKKSAETAEPSKGA